MEPSPQFTPIINLVRISVAKPLVAKSHELSLAYDEFSLQKLEPPLVLQEFINHGMKTLIVFFMIWPAVFLKSDK